MSLRWRWALTLSLVAALAIGLAIWAALLSAERQLRGGVDADLLERAAQVNGARDVFSIKDGVWWRARRSGIVDFDAMLQIFDPGGETILRISPADLALPIEASDLEVLAGANRPVIRTVRIGDSSYRMITARLRRPLGEATSPVAFQIARDLSPVEANLRGLTRRMLPIGVIGVLLVGITGWILASRAVRPIGALTETAEQIARTERLDEGDHLDPSSPGEIGRLAGAFSSMLSSLAASRREQQRLVADAGHELRTPITALKTNLETLHRQGERLPAGKRRELVETALEQSNQFAALTTELIDLASDVHHSPEEPTRIDLEELAAGVAHQRRQVDGKEIVVTGEGVPVSGRRSQLDRALGNLVDNALKWASGRVEINLDGARVRVLDDGPGIPVEDLPHVFRRFYRSRRAHSTPGSGLGLAIVEHLVTAHGGTVFARNRPEGGAEVGFTLPGEEGRE